MNQFFSKFSGSGKKSPTVDNLDCPECESGYQDGNILHGFDPDKPADDHYLPRLKRDRALVKQMSADNPQTRSAIDYKVDLAVGHSLRIKPNIMGERLKYTREQKRSVEKQAKELWKMFMESDHCWSDAGGQMTVTEQAAQHARIFDTEGEAMAAVFELGESRRSPMTFNVGNVNPARVRTPIDRADDLTIKDGIKKSQRGYPQEYYVHKYHENDCRAVNQEDRENYLPIRKRSNMGREQFIHSYVPVTSDLSRGISKLASCYKLSCQNETYRNAAIEHAIVNAQTAMVIKSKRADYADIVAPTGSTRDSMQEYMHRSGLHHKVMKWMFRNKQVKRLYPDEELEAHNFGHAGGASFEQFSMHMDTIAAACHDMPLEEYLQRWDRTNYSGARSGKLYLYRVIQTFRAQAPWKFARKLYCLFIEDMILQGYLKLPGIESAFDAWLFFIDHKEELTCVEFFGSARDEIDRAKTASAYLAEGQLGVQSKQTYCQEMLGRDYEDVEDEIITEVVDLYNKLNNTIIDGAPQTPAWSVAEMVTHRLYGGNAFLARKDLQDSGALDDDDSRPEAQAA